MLPTPCLPQPPDGRPWYEGLEVLPFKPVTAVIISPTMLGFQTHFLEQRTRPCLLPDRPCPYHAQKGELRWIGYLLVWAAYMSGPRRFQVSRGAYENCHELHRLQGLLRGKTLIASRMGKTINSGLRVDIQPPTEFAGKPAKLPECQLEKHLERMWGLTGQSFSSHNPVELAE